MAALTTEIVKREVQSGKSVIRIAKKYRVTRQAVYRHLNKLKKRRPKPKRKPKKNGNFIKESVFLLRRKRARSATSMGKRPKRWSGWIIWSL